MRSASALLLLLLALPAFAQPADGSCPEPAPGAAGALATDLSAAADAAHIAGPVGDYEPMSGVVVHEVIRRVSPSLFAALNDAMGTRLTATSFHSSGSGYTDPNLVWMRDYHPIYVRRPDGSLKVVQYLSINPMRVQYTGSAYIPVPPPDPSKKLYKIPGSSEPGRWLDHATLPIVMEAGNLVSTGKHVFVTEKLIADNAREWRDATHLPRLGYKKRTREEVVAEIATALEVAPANVVVVPSLPGEKTKHADLFLMPLSPTEVMIPEIRDQAIGAIGYGHEIDLARKAQAHLNEQAAAIASKGYTVTRLPMMPAVYLAEDIPPGMPRAALTEPPGWAGTYYSPANSLLFNDAQGDRRVFVPTFEPRGFPDGYRALNDRYQEEWAGAFRARGWNPTFVDATDLGRHSGLFRCVTYPIPK